MNLENKIKNMAKNKKYLRAYVKSIKDNGIIEGVASTEALDRDDERILASAWDLKNFKMNSPLLWSHQATELPIGKVTEVRVVDGKLTFNAIFAEEENEFAAKVAKMYRKGFINAFSVGYIPQESDGNTITKAELLEISAVNIPANPEALASREYKTFKEEIKDVWSREYINDLPDAAFALILPGGEKDEEGKTTPRSLRKLPHHNMTVKDPDENSSVDLPHLRNALARAPQMDVTEEQREKAIAHLKKHASVLLEEKDEETDNYIRIPTGISCTVTATIDISKEEGIKALYCGNEKKIRTYLFDKEKGWTMETAKEWVEEHGKSAQVYFIKQIPEETVGTIRNAINLSNELTSQLKELISNNTPEKVFKQPKGEKRGRQTSKPDLLGVLKIIDRSVEYAIKKVKRG